MKTKVLSLVILFLLGTSMVFAQVKTEKFEVKDNCGMCKTRIEKAEKSENGVSTADWNLETNILEVSFDKSKTSVHQIQMAIAKVGHDTPMNRTIKLAGEKKFLVLRVKGDGKRYEFRLKGQLSQYESYVHQFATSGEWENSTLAIHEFYPQFRRRKLNIPNFNVESIEQLSFFIANGKEEVFELLIDWIGLE